MALLSTAAGASMVTETIFEQRFRHVDELRKMGANIKVRGRTALMRGVHNLRGAPVTGTDVRAAAALVIAGIGKGRLWGIFAHTPYRQSPAAECRFRPLAGPQWNRNVWTPKEKFPATRSSSGWP